MKIDIYVFCHLKIYYLFNYLELTPVRNIANICQTIELQRWSPRGHIVKSLASKPQVLENCRVLGSRTALFFEWLKLC